MCQACQSSKMIVILLLMVTSGVLHYQCDGFNLWSQGATKFSGPKDSQFGFSVALWSNLKGSKSLVVGAPRNLLESTSTYNGTRLGNIFICGADGGDCSLETTVPFLSSNDSSEQSLSAGFTMTKYGMGFGMAMSSLKQNTSPLAVCAPRYPRLQENSMENRGACFILSDEDTSPKVIIPYTVKNSKGYTIQEAMMGFSAAFIDETETTLVMGGPGAFYGEGVVVNKPVFNDGKGYTNRIKLVNSNKADDFTYEGWEVVQGLFDGEQTSIAVSVVNYGNLTGKVKLYPKNIEIMSINPKNYLKEFFGSDVGAKFGYSLASGDFDGDKVDDLVIGSPLSPVWHPSYLPDAGKIVIYYDPLRKDNDPVEFFGSDPFGRYGFSVANVGDINRDGFDDLAVAAPYGGPEGRGTVYIYNGSPGGLLSKDPQEIQASSVAQGLRGFGFSLDGGIDMDANGYPDVLIGAVESDEAVFMRSAPVVTLEGSVKFQQDNLKVDDKDCLLDYAGYRTVKGVCFDMILDFKYQSLYKLNTISMEFRMVLRDQGDPPQFVFKVTNDYRYSTNISIPRVDENPKRTYVSIFAKSNRSVIGQPVKVGVTAHLNPPARGRRQSPATVPPVLDILSPTTFNALLILTCDNNKTCFSKPDMSLDAESNTLIIGEGPVNISVTLDVRNDPAYDVEVTVNHPHPLKFLRVEGDGLIPDCHYSRLVGISDYTKFSCKFTFIEADEKIMFTLFFDHKPLELLEYMDTVSGDQIILDLKVQSDSVDTNERDNAVQVAMDVETKAIPYTKGESFPETMTVKVNETLSSDELQKVILGTTEQQLSVDRLGPHIRQEFSFTNRGPSPIKGDKLDFHLALYQGADRTLYLLDEPKTSAKPGQITCRWPQVNPWNLQRPIKTESLTYLPANETDMDTETRRRREAISKSSLSWNDSQTYNPSKHSSMKEPHSRNAGIPSRDIINSQNSPLTALSSHWMPQGKNISNTEEDFLNLDQGAWGDRSAARPYRSAAALEEAKILECKSLNCTFTCNIGVLDVEDTVSVRIEGYLIIAALDKHGYRKVGIKSWVHAMVSQKGSTVINPMSPATTFVTLIRPPESGLSALPIWVAILAILGSILLILIIILVLWKAGFFKRNRPPNDPKRQSLIQNQEEKEEIREEAS